MVLKRIPCLRWLLIVFVTFSFSAMYAQNERQFETDPVILNRISQWQDLKFGLMMHWGI